MAHIMEFDDVTQTAIRLIELTRRALSGIEPPDFDTPQGRHVRFLEIQARACARDELARANTQEPPR